MGIKDVYSTTQRTLLQRCCLISSSDSCFSSFFFFFLNPLKQENQVTPDKMLHSKWCQSNKSQDAKCFPWNCLATAIRICTHCLRQQTKLKYCKKQHNKHPLFSLVSATIWSADLSEFSSICLGYLVPLPLRTHSIPTWTHFCVTSLGDPALAGGVGVDELQKSLPTFTILWFCDYLRITKVLTKHMHVWSQIKTQIKTPSLPWYLWQFLFFTVLQKRQRNMSAPAHFKFSNRLPSTRNKVSFAKAAAITIQPNTEI